MGRSPSPPRRRDARRERPERPDRPDRVERDRPDRAERERPDRAERERPDRAERDRRRPQRSRSRSPARRRSPDRRRSPSPRRRRSTSPGPSSSKPKPRKLQERPPVTQADLEGKTPEEQEMLRVMGFCGFDTTKGKKVDENDVGEVHVVLKRKYRQYMNRKGGFNRPLDFVA